MPPLVPAAKATEIMGTSYQSDYFMGARETGCHWDRGVESGHVGSFGPKGSVPWKRVVVFDEFWICGFDMF